MRNIVVTGADGFIGRNFVRRLSDEDFDHIRIFGLNRQSSHSDWDSLIARADVIIHLAGVNRSDTVDDFVSGNVESTTRLCRLVSQSGRSPAIFYASSTKAIPGSHYGDTKVAAEQSLFELADATDSEVNVCRLPNVYGKWSKPFYNSAVATFCHQIAHEKELQVNDDAPMLELLYIDDLVDGLMCWLDSSDFSMSNHIAEYTEMLSVRDLAERLSKMYDLRARGHVPSAGSGLDRRLYATLLSFMPADASVTTYASHIDSRGAFSELFKHSLCGQIAFLTSKPGVVRGEHFHHTKVERFVVLAGKAKFENRNVIDDTFFTVFSSAGDGKIIETLPGYAHNICNVGDVDLVVVLWANEVFDENNPDTYSFKVN